MSPNYYWIYNIYYLTELSIFKIYEKSHSIILLETATLQTGVP